MKNTNTPSQNVILDFTSSLTNLTANQELAVMPAEIAKRALRALVSQLHSTSFRDVKNDIVHDLAQTTTMEELTSTMTAFLQERELVDNVVSENWDAYRIDTPQPQASTII
jgi:hypothetical protein